MEDAAADKGKNNSALQALPCPSTDLGVGQRVEGHDNVAHRVLVLTLLPQQGLETKEQTHIY